MEDTKIGVIFDCDGTLIDSMGIWRELESSLASRAGVELTKEDKDALTTFTIPECGAYFYEHFGLGTSAEDVVGMIDDFMMDFYSHRACPRPGAKQFVEGLGALDVAMSVASSTPAHLLRACMDHVGLSPYFLTILSVDDVGASKRERVIYDRAREIMGTKPYATWGFEDSLYAVQTLRGAGYKTAGIYDCDLSATFEDLMREADIAIRSFEDIDAPEFLRIARSRL